MARRAVLRTEVWCCDGQGRDRELERLPAALPLSSLPKARRHAGRCQQDSSGGATAAGLWHGYVMQLAQPVDPTPGSTNKAKIMDELEVFESGLFAPMENGGTIDLQSPCWYSAARMQRAGTA